MSRTITALYDSRTDAEAARSRLNAANVDADNVRIMDQTSGGGMSSGSSDTGQGLWASLKDVFVADEDRHTYNEGMRRGGFLLCASADDDDTDRVIQLLDETGSVDLDDREKSWRSEGWAGYSPSQSTEYSPSQSTGTNYAANTGTTGNEEHIQLAEEQLVVGKREVNRGGARVRSYVVEKPVTEQVTLREEHVNVDRRPVDSTMQSGNLDNSALFQDRTIEMTETSEEAVIDKQARVTEEVTLSKSTDMRDETISDTVRKTEVDIDEGVGTSGASGSSGSSNSMFGSNNNNDRDRF